MSAELTHQSLFPEGVPDGCEIRYLEDICQGIFDCPHSTPKLAEEGPYLVRTQDIRCGYFDTENAVRVSWESYHERTKRSRPSVGDILFSREGTYFGDAAEVLDGTPVCLGQRMVLIRPDEGISPTFLRIWINSPRFQEYLKRYRDGTVAERVNVSAIRKLPVLLPEPTYQEYVIQHIVALESKIHLNRQINQTLEKMAQAIFKSWFVDFEPVKAKIAALEAGGSEDDALLAAMQAISGKAPEDLTLLQTAHPEQYADLRTTAELFPSAMQDSELGEIPEGWSCRALDDIAKYKNGLALQKFRPDNENNYLPVVKISQLKKGYADGEEKASPDINPECIIDNGDVVFSWSGSLLVDTWCGGRAALNQHLFKVTSETHPKWLYYHFTRHHLEEFQRIAADKAVTMGHIKREHLKRALCAIPCEQFISNAGNSLRSILEKQIELRLESITLSTLRDTLLPKLLSGELAISDAETQLAEAEEATNV